MREKMNLTDQMNQCNSDCKMPKKENSRKNKSNKEQAKRCR